MARVRVVLVRPETAVNVGTVARAMRNGGLDQLDLVAAGDWRRAEAWRSAWRAHEVLESARELADLETAVKGAAYVAAFSGKSPEGPSLDVREMAAEVAALPKDAEAALVFGPETSGLAADELVCCGRQVLIPSHPAQPSLNLAQAVMIAVYELFRAVRPWSASAGRRALSTHADKQVVLERLAGALSEIGALHGGRGVRAFQTWRRLLHRTDLTPRELRLLDHFARRLAPASARRFDLDVPARPSPPSPPEVDVFEDVRLEQDGFSLPLLKWRELLFLGAVREESGTFSGNPKREAPAFRAGDLFPIGARFEAAREGPRVRLRRLT